MRQNWQPPNLSPNSSLRPVENARASPLWSELIDTMTRPTEARPERPSPVRQWAAARKLLPCPMAGVILIAVLITIIVPIKPSQCQRPQPQPTSVVAQPRFAATLTANHPIKPNQATQRVQQNYQPPVTRRNEADLQQELTNYELQQILRDQSAAPLEQQSQLRPKTTRPMFISDFVSNQSHRLLRNLVNNTLADLVANQKAPLGNTLASRLIHANHHREPSPYLAHQADRYQFGSPVSDKKPTERPYLPAIGRLYSYLFPNQVQQEQRQQQQQLDHLKVGEPILADELIEPSSSDAIDLYDPASGGGQFGAREAEPAKATATKFISLSAPYESNEVRTSLLQVPALELAASNESQTWHRHKELAIKAQDAGEQQDHSGANFVESSADHDDTNPIAEPEFVQQANDKDQMDSSDSNNQGGEFKLDPDEQAENASNHLTMDYEAQDYLSQGKHQQQPVFLNHQMMAADNESLAAIASTTTTSESSSGADSFLNQLPSTYESAPMRVPPEGYYDDYYKLASSQTMGYQSPLMESLISSGDPQSVADNQLAHGFGAAANTTNGTTSSESAGHDIIRPLRLDQTIGGQQLDQFYLNQQPVAVGQDYHHQHPMRLRNGTVSTGYEMPTTTNSSIIGHQPLDSNGTVRYLADQDNIRLILANTNSSFDPVSNEKVINYISEGHNETFRPASGKSPRHTFVNKDMNELPPDNAGHQNGSSPLSEGQRRAPQLGSGSGVVRASTTTSNPPPLYLNNGEGEKFYLPSRAFDDNNNNKQPQRATTESSGTSYNEIREPNQEARADSDEVDAGADMDSDQEAIRRLSPEDGGHWNYGQYNRDRNQRQQQQQQKKQQNRSNRAKGDKNGPNARGRKRQQSIRRPQVTQAHFDPKSLILSAPTPQPSVTESALETITELPSKVKKFRENQPDKNELMNELLTALDRVKVAIYKLQPLTAKMNAIYRKSVTSNTRDTVLDNNKGTYAKRYPPGDYDDSYDRLHPSELLVPRSNPSASSRKGRRAEPGGGATGKTSPKRQPRRITRRMAPIDGPDQLADESATSATYLPAPKGNLSLAGDALTGRNQSADAWQSDDELLLDESDEIVATGIGRRMGDGRLTGEVVSFGLLADDDDDDNLGLRQKLADKLLAQDTFVEPSNDSLAPTNQVEPDSSLPTFGYRITIYRSPDEGGDWREEEDETASASERNINSIGGGGHEDGDQDLMVTSESSLVPEPVPELQVANGTTLRNVTAASANEEADDTMSGSESRSEQEEQKGKKAGEKWNSKMEKKDQKAAKSGKSEERKRKADEESKKRKEYKKIKHNKGLVSKESKKMHRDKHIKAHDRGAAKEKALKERTQIEFFEREQIVDDEFEKAKKSTIKAGWQTGQEAKKSSKDISGGSGAGADSMSMGGSHFVAHEQPASFSEKGHGSSMESSSGKKSNKFEKKDMESKGKKFKGWREKGYKIITETEFIDRGSLHDSAYKKRDKGAAHHQKYKKQEASSEGHHGSMQEHHKKSHKKEDKRGKTEEKQVKKGQSEEEHRKRDKEKKVGRKAASKGKDEQADEQAESTLAAATIRPTVDETIEMMNRNQRSRQPISVGSRALHHFAPTAGLGLNHLKQSSALSRLLNAEHDSRPPPPSSLPPRFPEPSMGQRPNATSNQQHQIVTPNPHLSSNDATTIRRSDGAVSASAGTQIPLRPGNASALYDIVDNFTGQKMNKTRVGTYEVHEEPGGNDLTVGSINRDSRRGHQSSARPANLGPLAPESRVLRQPSGAGIGPQQPGRMFTSSTPRPKPGPGPSVGDKGRAELDRLVGLLRQSEQHNDRLQPGEFGTLGGPFEQQPAVDHQYMVQSNNFLAPESGQPNNARFGLFLQQLASSASGNPSEMFDFAGNSFAPTNHDHTQTSALLAQGQPLPMAASNYQQVTYFHPPGGQFGFGQPQQAVGSALFPRDQLLDYDSDTGPVF